MYALLPWIALALFVLLAALLKPAKRERGRLLAACVFLALWALVWGASSLAPRGAIDAKVVGEVSLALVELAAIQVAVLTVMSIHPASARLPRFAVELIVFAGYVLILFRLLYALGVNVTGIFATSAVAAAVVAIALQEMLGNIASGIALQIERGLHPGDFIRSGELCGRIHQVRVRHTAIDTPEGDRLLVPNSVLTRSPVVVISRAHRYPIPFVMPYSRDPQELIDAVELALRNSPIPDVANDPQPCCVIQEMAPGHIRYAAIVWLARAGVEPFVISAVLNRVYCALARAGIPADTIPQLLELKAEMAHPGAVSPADALRCTAIFQSLDDADLTELSGNLRHLVYAPGEVIFRQHEEGDSMYFVLTGQVGISLETGDGAQRQIAVIGPSEFVGEISLLTGAPRHATGAALTRTGCYRLDAKGLQRILSRRPEIAEDMSAVIARRLGGLAEAREKLDQETARLRQAESQTQLLTRIRRFFSIDGASAS